MKKIFNILILSFSISIFLGLSFALNIPKNDWYVLDQANILTQQQEQILESTILNARKSTDIEVWILIINSLEWEDIFTYSLDVAEARWVGDKNKDNGFVMVFAMQDRERRIQVGYGLEWVITDSIAKRLWEKNITNNFRNWLYFEWINNTLQDVISYINKDPATLEYINASTNSLKETSNNDSSETYLGLFIMLIFVIKSLVLKYDKKTKKSKIKKWWRIALVIIWAIVWLLAYRFIFPSNLLYAWLFGYGISILWIFVWMLIGDWNTFIWAMLLGRGWRWWSWGWGFWGFGWGGFWGGGGWWRR